MKNNFKGEGSLCLRVPTASGYKSGEAFINGTLAGTAITDAETTSPYNATIECSTEKAVKHAVSNVLTYNAGAEATWGAIDVGDKVYFDASGLKDNPMISGKKIKLSTSPQDKDGNTNVQWGVAAEAMSTATATVAEILVIPVR